MEENQVSSAELIPVSSLDLITKAEIDMQISTAKAFPRSLKTFLNKAMSMATITENVAAACNYAISRGGKSIQGPTVRLAEIIVSSYGNTRSGARVISNDGKFVTAQGICHDLESNTVVTVEVLRRITGKDGKTFSDDMIAVTANAACAIAFRNAVFKVIPVALVQEVYDKTKEVARGTAATLPARRQKAIEFFTEQGVKEKQIIEALGIKKIEDIDLDKLEILSGMRSALKNGEATLDELFGTNEISVDDIQLQYDMKKGFLTEAQQTDIERILKNKEKQSYKKALAILADIKV